MGLLKTIKCDLVAKARKRYGSGSFRSVLKVLMADGSFAMIVYRLMQWSQRKRLVPLAMLFNKVNVVFGGCVIGRGADFEDEFVLLHSNGVVINSDVRGGRRVYLEHQVTIGSDDGESPVLGNDVYVGCGARILGAIQVGSRVRVGANAVVVSNVEDGCTVGGIPARVIRRESVACNGAAEKRGAQAPGNDLLTAPDAVGQDMQVV
jgi:serine O-acetyltransferase